MFNSFKTAILLSALTGLILIKVIERTGRPYYSLYFCPDNEWR